MYACMYTLNEWRTIRLLVFDLYVCMYVCIYALSMSKMVSLVQRPMLPSLNFPEERPTPK